MNWRILLLTVPLVAMSCAGPAAPEPAGSASVTEESVTEEPAEERPEEGAFDAWPINALSDSEAGISESEIVEFEEIEQLIGECMRAQGFEYSPIDIREITTTFDPTDPWGGLHYGSEEWIAKFGFGVTTLTSLEKIEAHQAERDDPDNLSPQEAYFASLNDQELSAYQRAISGTANDTDPFDPNGDIGCMAAASLAVMGEPEPPDPALDDLRYELFSDLQEIMEAEPRFIEDQARAQECIESAGHLYRDEDQLWIYLEEQDEVLQDTIDTSLDNRPTVFVGQLTSNQPGEDPLEIRSTVTPIPDEDEAELVMADDELAEYIDSVHAEEVTLARAYLDCDATLLPIMTSAVYRDVRIEIEEQFIRDNRTAFERLGFFDE